MKITIALALALLFSIAPTFAHQKWDKRALHEKAQSDAAEQSRLKIPVAQLLKIRELRDRVKGGNDAALEAVKLEAFKAAKLDPAQYYLDIHEEKFIFIDVNAVVH